MKGQKRTLKRGIFIICFYDKLIIRDRIKLRNVGKEVFNGAVAVKYTRKCEIFVKLNVKKNNLGTESNLETAMGCAYYKSEDNVAECMYS